ncbi:FAD-dependent oxidoreductase [uncultured Dietzia sp.]|uniref:FAD-dependent oxidoreductase n=1 Tax=uncultured Dietzia sp. TaxID=395519 RepID=UPI0025DF6F2C|nr:FAD-dependent oxidoreductase [uncultured Dietzia sp.]
MAHQEWDTTVDLLVVGSGAGGMTTALTAAARGMSTMIVEKADVYGGNTALSGGGVWIPNNPVLAAEGIVDPADSVLEYLSSITGGVVPEERLRAYVETGPEAFRFLQETSEHMRFVWCRGYSDYHPENPGGRPDGRSVEPEPIDILELGEDADRLRQADLAIPPGLWMTQREFRDVTMMMRTGEGRRMALTAACRMATGLFRRRKIVALGTALVTRLRLALRDQGVPLWLGSPLSALVTGDNGDVIGAEIVRHGVAHRIRATRGVVMATGGFEFDDTLRSQHLPPGGVENFSAGAPSNTGDGHAAGTAVGAGLALMDDAWWMPAIRLPDDSVVCLVSERAIPRALILDGSGRRFTNEASPYVNFVHTQIEGGHDPVWFIMDATAKRRYQFGGIMPGQPFPKAWYRSGLVHRADTPAALARSIGLPPDQVESSIARYNELARSGRDSDFGRGESAYDRYYGDDSLSNPVLDEVTDGPFYGIRVVAGDLGTKGGLRCDESSRVLREDGSVIDGLYATGNCSAAVMGHDYAGPGATIGPAMVFGWIAATHASEKPVGHLLPR